MNFKELNLSGVYEIELAPKSDDRGFFERLYCREELNKMGLETEIAQINRSVNNFKGAFRGLHYQKPPFSEIKIVTCLKGAVIDFVVDLRKESATFLHWLEVKLSEENNKAIVIPQGFAHGFQTLQDSTELLYFHTQFYNPEYESGINYKDPFIKIKLPLEISEISEKDKTRPFLSNIELDLPDFK